MLTSYRIGEVEDRNDEVFFAMLSEDAKRTALMHMGISDPREANWDVFPLAYTVGSVKRLDQQEIDDSALSQLGCYACVA